MTIVKPMTDKWCVQCLNRHICKYIAHPPVAFYCPGMERIINNNKDLKEPLLSDLNEDLTVDNIQARDYKAVLNEMKDLLTAEKRKRFLDIINMPCDRKKIIACLLWFGIPTGAIIRALKIKEWTFYRIVKK